MPLESIVFSTAGARSADPFAAYRDLSAADSDAVRFGTRFHARVRVRRFPRMIVSDRQLDGVVHSRTPARVMRDGFDHAVIHLLVAGRLTGEALGIERTLQAGEILVFDTAQPHRMRFSEAHLITVSLARDQVEQALPALRPFHGAVLPDTVGGLLADFMASLNRRADKLPAAVAQRASRTAAELLALALTGRGQDGGRTAATETLALMRRERVEAFIVARLAEPGLDAKAVVDGTGLSRSSVYRIFEPDGGIARFIQRRRLVALRNALRRGEETRSIAALAAAHGFASESHCNRLFRAEFGKPPGQFRDDMQQARLDRAEPGTPMLRLVQWNSELC